MLHVAHINVDPADVIHGAARGLDSGLEVLADLAGLRFDVAYARDGAVGASRCHAGDEYQPAARLDHRGLRKMAARPADFRRHDLLLGHGFLVSGVTARPARRCTNPASPHSEGRRKSRPRWF